MESTLLELEGTWEEVLARAPDLVGRHVRLTVFPATANESRRERFWTVVGDYCGGELFELGSDVATYLEQERNSWDK